MDFDPAELDALSRDELILRARARGVDRPEQMTRVELRDEIVRRSEPDLERQRRSRGWLGVARDLLASVVESGLNLPDAAATIRGEGQPQDFQGPPPVATVTLAEIYAAQGHYEQALRMVEEVIEREPEHTAALAVRDRIAEERDLGPGRRRKVVETKGDPILTPQAPPVALRPEPVAAPAPTASLPSEPVVAVEPSPEPVAAPPLVAEQGPEPVVAAPVEEQAPEPVVAVPVEEQAQPTEAAAPVASAPSELELEALTAAADVEPPPVISPALLVLQVDGRAFVYWRVPHLSGALRLRTVAVQPSSAPVTAVEEDYAVGEHVGGIWLSRQTRGAEVRAAVGDVTSDGFDVLTVARVLRGDTAVFEPPGALVDPELEDAARQAAGL
jgi:hypothetical protein